MVMDLLLRLIFPCWLRADVRQWKTWLRLKPGMTMAISFRVVVKSHYVRLHPTSPFVVATTMPMALGKRLINPKM